MAKNCKKFLCIQKLSLFFVSMETITTPHWGVSWGRWLSYGMLLKGTKCFLCFLLVTMLFGWFKVYFKQPIGSWLQKCNPHLYNLDHFLLSDLDQICFIECSRARIFWFFWSQLNKSVFDYFLYTIMSFYALLMSFEIFTKMYFMMI